MESLNFFVMPEHGLFRDWRSPFRLHMLLRSVSGSAQSQNIIRVWFLRLNTVTNQQERNHLNCTRALLHILEHHLLALSHLASIYIIGGIFTYRTLLRETGAEVIKKIKSVHVSQACLESEQIEKVWKGLWKSLPSWHVKKETYLKP